MGHVVPFERMSAFGVKCMAAFGRRRCQEWVTKS
jgi:hypothetical protein